MADITFATNFLNISYVEGDLAHQASVRANPSIKLFQIKEAGGASVESRFMLRGAAGMSGNLTDAQAIAAQNKNGRHYRWQVPFGKTRGSFRVPYEDIIQSKLDEAAEAQALELEMDKGLAECGSKLVQLLFGRSGLAGGLGVYVETASEERVGRPDPHHGLDSTCLQGGREGLPIGLTGDVVDLVARQELPAG